MTVVPERMTVLHVGLDVAAQYDGAGRREFDTVLGVRTLCHVIFERIDTGRIKLAGILTFAGDLVKNHHIFHTNDADLLRGAMVKERCGTGLPTGDHKGPLA